MAVHPFRPTKKTLPHLGMQISKWFCLSGIQIHNIQPDKNVVKTHERICYTIHLSNYQWCYVLFISSKWKSNITYCLKSQVQATYAY